MSSPSPDTFVAPPRIIAANREQFRKASLGFIEQVAGRGAAIVTFDFTPVEELDACGLGLLVQMQKRADALGVSLNLAHMPRDVRLLLKLTRLEHLFTIVDG